MKTKITTCRARLTRAGLILALAPAALASDVIKANNTGNLDLGASWVSGTPPGASDVGVWDATVTAANAVLLGASANWAGIRITNVGGAVSIGNDGNTLTLGASGIDMTGAGYGLTLGCILDISNDQTWNLGTRSLALSGANTGSGGLTLTGGTVFEGTDTAFGAGTLTLNGCSLASLNGSGHRTIANPIVVATGTTNNLYGFNGGSWTTYTGTLSGSGTIGCVNPTGGGRTDFNGDMSGFSGTLWYHNMPGGSSLILTTDGSAAARFATDGTTTSGAYNWFFVQVPSSVFYMGELSGTGGTVTAVGNYTIFEVGALNTSATYAGTIGQNGPQVGLNKVGTGTLELSGPNNDAFSYTDTTTVSAGTLWVSGTLSRSSGVTVNDGATLKVTAHGATAAIATGGALTLGSSVGGATNQFVELSSTGTAPIQAGSLALTGTTTINILSGTLLAGQTYPLIGFTTLDGAGNFVLGTLPAGVTATVVTNGSSIALAVLTAPGLNDVWNGNLSGIWDITNTANWMLNGTPGKTFHQGDLVRFDDTASGTTTVSNTVTVSPSSITVDNTTKAYTIGGSAIAGGASLTKSGTNTLTLTGTNTFTGDITLTAGTLTIGDAGQCGGGTFAAGISNNGAFNYQSSSPQTLSGIISGAGTLAQLGTGTLTLSGTNTFTGGLTLTGGTVAAGSDTALGTGTLTLSGGSLTAANGTRTIANPLVIAAGTSNNLYGNNGGRYCVFEGPITGSGTIGGVNSAGGNTTFKSDISGFTGTIWHDNSAPGGNSFQFQSTSPAAYDGSQAHFVTSGSTTPGSPSWFMLFGADGYTVRMGELSGPGGHIATVYPMTYEIGALNTSTTYHGHLTQNGCCGAASLVKVGTGTLTLTYANTYAGTTTVSGGTLVVSSAQTSLGVITVNDNTTLGVTVSGSSQLKPEALYEGSSVGGATNDFYGVSSTGTAPVQAGSLIPTGTTTVNILSGTLLAGQTYPLINYTTLSGSGDFVLGTLPAGVTANLVNSGGSIALAVLTAPGLNDVWNGNLSGTWDITNTANWMLNGTPGKTFHQGDLVWFDDTASGTTTVSNTVTVSPSSITVSNTTKAYTIGGSAIAGGAGLTKSGTNALTLTGTNTFAGDITLNAGTLTIGDAGQLGGGTFAAGISNNGAFNYLSSAEQTLSGIISGAGTLAKNGTGTLTLKGSNTFTGSVTLTGGTVFEGTDTAFGDGTGTLTLNGCSLAGLNGTGARTIANPIVVATGTTNNLYGFNGGTWTTYAGTLSGSGTIGCVNPTVGGGRTDFSGDMSGFSGTLWYHNMSGGSSLLLFNAGSASAHFVTDGTTTSGAYNWFFAVSPSPTFYMGELSGTGGTVTAVGDTISLFEVGALNTSATYAGTIGQNGPQVGLNKVGTGTLELSGPNNDAFSYTGTTTVSAGTLWVSGTLSRSSGLTVNDGATLKVTAHGATAAIATGGALTLGSGVGGATNQFVEVSSTGTAPIQAGSLTLTGTTTIDILSGGMLAGQTYPLIGFTTLDGAGNFVLGTLPAGVTATLVTSGSSIALAVTSVLAPPTISGGTMLPGGSFEIMFSGPAGQSFKVLGTNVITAPLATWPVLLNGTFGIGGPVATNFIDSGTATNRLGFYRIVSP